FEQRVAVGRKRLEKARPRVGVTRHEREARARDGERVHLRIRLHGRRDDRDPLLWRRSTVEPERGCEKKQGLSSTKESHGRRPYHARRDGPSALLVPGNF